MINLNLSVLLPTNSKALKHLLMCLSLGDQSLVLLFVSSFLFLMYAFVNPPLLIIENNAILLCYFAFAIMEGEAVKEASVETGFMLPKSTTDRLLSLC